MKHCVKKTEIQYYGMIRMGGGVVLPMHKSEGVLSEGVLSEGFSEGVLSRGFCPEGVLSSHHNDGGK